MRPSSRRSAHDDAALLAVHDPALLEFLATAWEAWERAGLPADPGQDRVVPYIFPHPGCSRGLEPARAGRHLGADRGVLLRHDDPDRPGHLGGGARRCRRGADRGRPRRAAVRAAAYACCRPPGHHVTRSAYGGSCYLNNAAIAAARLRELGVGRVGIVDVDAHHGNGAQSIFWERRRRLHRLGPRRSRGRAGSRTSSAAPTSAARAREPARTATCPLAAGAGDERVDARPWPSSCRRRAATASEALVLALGVDAAGGDPESPLDVTEAGYREAGRIVGSTGLPVVVVQEGGYDLALDRRARARHAGGPRGGPEGRHACLSRCGLDREGRGRGRSLAAAQGPEAAAALAPRGDRRDRAAALAHARRRQAHLRLHPGPRHVRRLAARPRRAAARGA